MPMNVLILEDEMPAANRLVKMLEKCAPEAKVLDIIDSVEDAVEWLNKHDAPDLCFMDISLADGLSFEVFRQVKIDVPVIFTTAFDQYAVRAFRVNGLDYLLKPVEEEEFQTALGRFKSMKFRGLGDEAVEMLMQLNRPEKHYRERFLVKIGEQLHFVAVEEIAWCETDSGYVNVKLWNGNKVLLDKSLDQVRGSLDPNVFFQVNRKMIVHIKSVSKIYTHLNSRLKLELSPSPSGEVIVSRDRVKGFKEWLDR